LVLVLVRLFPATSTEGTIAFRMIHKPSGKPIKYLKGIETERGFEEVGEEEIIKGGDQCRKFVFGEQLLTRRKGSPPLSAWL
jgi:non-homologous end joining protein Ku